jgi:hypothetical protein
VAKTTTPLTAQERVILFCTATGVSHAAVGITAHAMQSMAIKGFIAHNRESGAYALTDSGRATLAAILENAVPEKNPANELELLTCAPMGAVATGRRPKLRFQNISGLPQGPAGASGTC